MTIPRLVIAGTASNVGKTTVMVGLVRALRARGLSVAVFKCGPDYLDPTYHVRAAGAPCHNLDGWMMGREAVLSTFMHASQGADIALLEGVMGLFDGASPTSDEGSTAEIAKWLQAPVLLVCDAGGMARSIAALAKGFSTFDPDLQISGLICNRLGSRGHLDLLRKATEGKPPVLGGLPKEVALAFADRHLGLYSADRATVPEDVFVAWGDRVSEWCDVDAIVALAQSAPALPEIPAMARIVGEGQDAESVSPSTRPFTSIMTTTSAVLRASARSSCGSLPFTMRTCRMWTVSISGAAIQRSMPKCCPGTSPCATMWRRLPRPKGLSTVNVAGSCICPTASGRSMAHCIPWWGSFQAKRK